MKSYRNLINSEIQSSIRDELWSAVFHSENDGIIEMVNAGIRDYIDITKRIEISYIVRDKRRNKND